MENEPDNPDVVQECPLAVRANRTVNGVKWLAGVGDRKNAQIMFLAPCVSEEEAADRRQIGYDRYISIEPRMLNSAAGQIFKDLCTRAQINMEHQFYTTIVRFLPANKAERSKLNKTTLKTGLNALDTDLREVGPRIVVCLGKQAFDIMLPGLRAKEGAVKGVWFYNSVYRCHVYYMPHLSTLLSKPETAEFFLVYLRAVKRRLDEINGVDVPTVATSYSTIRNSSELREFVAMLKAENQTQLAIDCEWEGPHHVDCKLRSMQICWKVGHATYIRFRDETDEYVFDVPFKEAGQILGEWLDQPQVKYIGHHLSVDLAAIHHHLGLQWYQKALFDTEFAQQCCDESSELGLKALAVKYTDLGNYSWDVTWWLRQHPDKKRTGFGGVPDDILIPYGQRDADATMRIYEQLKKELTRQGLDNYYYSLHLPFVTDVFTGFLLYGLPVDRAKIDSMREFYNWANREMMLEFRKEITKEAEELLLSELTRIAEAAVGTDYETDEKDLEEADETAGKCCAECVEAAMSGNSDTLRSIVKKYFGPSCLLELDPFIEHFIAAPTFNLRSKPQMSRWIFDVKKYTPVRSTDNKAAGMPAVDWERVMSYPPEKRKTFTPASDKGTLEILQSRHRDDMLAMLLQLNAIGNICKSFLKEPDAAVETLSDDTEEQYVKENGLHYWITSDDRFVLHTSCTETGRPRSWNPNSLNWPSWIHKRLAEGMAYIIGKRKEENQIPKHLENYAKIPAKKLPTIRSVSVARPGWCIVEADYQTAEMRGLAYISGDTYLIKMIEEPDDCFVCVRPEFVPDGYSEEDITIRVKWPEYVQYPVDKDKYINTCTLDGTTVLQATPDMFARKDDGSLIHPKFDMHWSVVELARKTAREVMDKKKDRGAGKTTNFCLAVGSLVDVLRDGIPTRVAIEDVQLTDLVWDGDSWVQHEGIVFNGRKVARFHNGLWATDNHDVWDSSGEKRKFESIRTVGAELFQACGAGLYPMATTETPEIKTKYVRCYDILNAGPQHRYTCSGVLVSNSSSYGGMAASIARKIESDTGNKPEIEDVEALLTAIRDRQPIATKFFEEMEKVPEEQGFYRCASGRIRHFHVLSSGITGLSARTRNGLITALGREARNVPMQESVAATASRACVSMLDFKMKTGLQGYAMICLYDSVVVHCPWTERRVWEKALKLFMYLAVGWKYHGRILRYPIDIEYNGAWSTKAPEPLNSLYKTPEWMPTQPCHAAIEKWLDLEIEKYEAHPELSLLPQDR